MSCPLTLPKLPGLHEVRVLNVAVLDVAGTIAGAWLVQRYMYPDVALWFIVFVLMLIAAVVHYWRGIPTTLNYLVGLSERPALYRDNYALAEVVRQN